MSTTRWAAMALRPRDPAENHRVASPLELFFDLVFVVAVAQASAELHHAEAEQHIVSGVGAYAALFFAVWWAWMNFTWFASAFDTDDWLYRVLTLVQMAGALVLASGAREAMTDGDFTVVTVGYVIMRSALVVQWLRAAAGDSGLRSTAVRYAIGITIVQVLWVARLWLPDEAGAASFAVLVLAELAVPAWAERARRTPWHPPHIAERYGLFTLIVLGEAILASTNAIADARAHAEQLGPLLVVAGCGLILAAGMWWVYFSVENAERLTSLRTALTFGYCHYLVFAAAGAFSAGIGVAIDHDTGATGLDAALAAGTLTVPVAVFVLGTWALNLRHRLARWQNVAVPVAAVLLAGAAVLPQSLPVAAAAMVVIIAVVESYRATARSPMA